MGRGAQCGWRGGAQFGSSCNSGGLLSQMGEPLCLACSVSASCQSQEEPVSTSWTLSSSSAITEGALGERVAAAGWRGGRWEQGSRPL